MARYVGPAFAGLIVAVILSFFITPFLSVLIGGFLAGYLSKGGILGGSGVGFLLGVITAVPVILFAGAISVIPYIGPIIGIILGVFGFGLMLAVGAFGLIGGFIGGMLGGKE